MSKGKGNRILKDEREKVNEMKVKDLLIKCSNVGLNDNVNLYALIIDSATNEIEKI